MKKIATFEEMDELLSYDPETGDLHWKKRISSVRAGDVAGHKASDGYVDVTVRGRKYPAHRTCWLLNTGAWPIGEIDHADGNPSNNRIENLRDVDRVNNARNQKQSCRNKSGTMGVRLHSRDNRWEASIGYKKRFIFLGYFSTKEEAVTARKEAEVKYDFHANHGRVSLDVQS